MACFESLLARRILLWYILLVSFVIFPLTLDLSLGCRFILVGIDDQVRKEYQGFGLFNAAVYDRSGGEFLGCVDYSSDLKAQTNDIGFRASRYAGGFLLAFTTLATLVCICVQCFSKSGKTWLWNVMRFSYTGACLCQGATYAIFSSEICSSFEGTESQCWMGRNGVAGVFNFVFLLGMVIATFYSFPPRHPVFQCWGGNLDHDEGASTDEEDLEYQKDKAIEGDTSVNDSNNNESVSLFGNSRASRSVKSTRSVKSSSRSVKSSKSHKSVLSTNGSRMLDMKKARPQVSLKESMTEDDDKYSAAESSSLRERGIINSVSKEETPSDVEHTTKEGVAIVDSIEKQGDGTREPPTNGSLAGSISARIWKFDSMKKFANKMNSGDNQSTSGSFKGVSKRVSKIETAILDSHGTRAKSVHPNDAPPRQMVSNLKLEGIHPEARPKSYPIDLEDSESIQFLKELAAVTKLGHGGLRVKTTEQDHRIEIVDEYPAKAGEGLNAPHSSDGADVVKVRTEYYEQGTRTTKEVTHHDGSRTVVTVIDSKTGTDNEAMSDNDSISTKQAPQGQGSNVITNASVDAIFSSESGAASKAETASMASEQRSIAKVDSKADRSRSTKEGTTIEQRAERESVSKNDFTLETKVSGQSLTSATENPSKSRPVTATSRKQRSTGSVNTDLASESNLSGRSRESKTLVRADSKSNNSRSGISKPESKKSRNSASKPSRPTKIQP